VSGPHCARVYAISRVFKPREYDIQTNKMPDTDHFNPRLYFYFTTRYLHTRLIGEISLESF